MTDIYDKQTRNRVMSQIRSKNSKPEIIVRSLLHNNGFRFGLHRSDLPGSPDIVLPKYKSVIFVNGCFWHQHKKCKYSKLPKSNIDYWSKKLKRNTERDKENYNALEKLGWNVLVVWECEIQNKNKLLSQLKEFLLIE